MELKPILYWFGRSTSTKLGDIPSAAVGATLKETRSTCEGCGLLESGQCYAHAPGSPVVNFGLLKLHEGLAKDGPKRYTIDGALKLRDKKRARYARVSSIGDAARAHRGLLLRDLAKVKAAGLRLLAYTHFWRDNPKLKADFVASCNDMDEADEAQADGWRTTCVLPWDHYEEHGPVFFTPNGTKGVVCPAQTKKVVVTCNSCGLCSNEHRAAERVKVIGFLDHGPAARHEKRAGRHLPMFQEA